MRRCDVLFAIALQLCGVVLVAAAGLILFGIGAALGVAGAAVFAAGVLLERTV